MGEGDDGGFGGSGFGVSDSAADSFGTEGFGSMSTDAFGGGISGPGLGFGDANGFGQAGFSESAPTEGFSISPEAFDATLGNLGLTSLMDDSSPFGYSLADYGLSQGVTSSPGFSFADAPSVNTFGTPAFNEDGWGKFGKGLMSFMNNPVAKAALSLADKSGLFGPVANIANLADKSVKGDQAGVGKGFGSMFGGMLGAAAGPVGAMAGSALGGYAGQALGGVTANQGMSGVPGQGTDGFNGGGMVGDVAGGLAGIYMGNRAKGQYNQALNNLNDIFSPNGVYAQQLRQQLERRDAAAGRRSQYGPREAQLMGMLADRHAQTLSSPGYANLMQQRGVAQNQGLNTLLALMTKTGLGNKMGDWIGKLGDGIQGMSAGGGLGSLFNGGYSNNWDMPADSGPQLPDSFLGDNWFTGGDGYIGE